MASNTWRARRSAVYAARRRIDGEHLVDALADTDVRVRRAAAMCLGEIHERSAVGPLLRVLDVRDDRLRIIAVKSLAEIGDSTAVPRLVALAEDETEPVPTRTTAIVALRRLGHPGAVELLARLLRHPKRSYRRWALRQLEDGADSRTATILKEAAESAGWLERRHIRHVLRGLSSRVEQSVDDAV